MSTLDPRLQLVELYRAMPDQEKKLMEQLLNLLEGDCDKLKKVVKLKESGVISTAEMCTKMGINLTA